MVAEEMVEATAGVRAGGTLVLEVRPIQAV